MIGTPQWAHSVAAAAMASLLGAVFPAPHDAVWRGPVRSKLHASRAGCTAEGGSRAGRRGDTVASEALHRVLHVASVDQLRQIDRLRHRTPLHEPAQLALEARGVGPPVRV